MKFISITNNFDAGQQVFYCIADTAMQRDGRPFFIPDFAEECTISLQIAFRISRLGRSISSRFALRYIDAWAPACCFTAHPLKEELCKKGLPWETAISFDGALCLGKFVSSPQPTEEQTNSFCLQINGQVIQEAQTKDMRTNICDMIAGASKFFMLRQGDILLSGDLPGYHPIKRNDHVDAYINNEKLLSFNIK